jgi:hypothetical protein
MTLIQIYATLPTIQCKKLCHESCGPIGLLPVEALLLLPKTPKSGIFEGIMFDVKTCSCPHLTEQKTCGVYLERAAGLPSVWSGQSHALSAWLQALALGERCRKRSANFGSSSVVVQSSAALVAR